MHVVRSFMTLFVVAKLTARRLSASTGPKFPMDNPVPWNRFANQMVTVLI
jgi:hypothetical protein